MRRIQIFAVVVMLLCILCVAVAAAGWWQGRRGSMTMNPRPVPARKDGDAWLLGAASDLQRFDRLERNLRGFSAQMIEVGERFMRLDTAVKTQNYDMALYQLDKIKAAIEAGLIKRPRRKASADLYFFQTAYPVAKTAFKSAKQSQSFKALHELREACMACHKSEKIAFMNEQPVFWRTKPTPSPAY